MVKKYGGKFTGKMLKLADKIYAGKGYRKIHRELCDYAKFVLPKTKKIYRFQFKCDKSLGWYGTDAPRELINLVTKEAGRHKYDAVIMNGDFIGHDRAPEAGANKSKIWAAFKKNKILMKKTFAIVRKNLGKTQLLPTVGNNDVLAHGQAPCDEDEAKKLYGLMWDTWFPNWSKSSDNYVTFMYGGFYRYDFTKTRTTVLALNTMFYKYKNKCGHHRG
jgi:hypothetical protein